MTKEQIIIEADKYNRSLSKHPMSVKELTEVLVGFYDKMQLLKQCIVSGSLPEYNEILYHARNCTDVQFREYWDDVKRQ